MLCKQHSRSLISAFVIGFLEYQIENLLQAKFHFYLVSVAKENLTFSETHKTGPNHFICKSKIKCVHACLNPFVLCHGFNGVARTSKKVSTSKGVFNALQTTFAQSDQRLCYWLFGVSDRKLATSKISLLSGLCS